MNSDPKSARRKWPAVRMKTAMAREGQKVQDTVSRAKRASFERSESASVLVFAWGLQFLPVFLTGVSQNETLHLPNLAPYRAEMTLTMQIIESNNPFFMAEKVRQTAMTALNAVTGF